MGTVKNSRIRKAASSGAAMRNDASKKTVVMQQEAQINVATDASWKIPAEIPEKVQQGLAFAKSFKLKK